MHIHDLLGYFEYYFVILLSDGLRYEVLFQMVGMKIYSFQYGTSTGVLSIGMILRVSILKDGL